MNEYECDKCQKTKSYKCRYILKWDLQVCNDCFIVCEKEDWEKYNQAVYEIEYDL